MKHGEKGFWKTVVAFISTDRGDMQVGIHVHGLVVDLEQDYDYVNRRPDVDG
ncbi:hypothetical protein BH23CHL4_BH23CHL4_21930 [soil metagenome]